MLNLSPIEPVDYLIIGHLTQDLTANGPALGGTASYAARTAQAIGLRVGIVTSCASDINLDDLKGVSISMRQADYSTTFENNQTPNGRIQYIHHVAAELDYSMVPVTWRNTPIVHLGPVAQEVDPRLARAFSDSQVCLTPQGWLRSWNSDNLIHPTYWPEARFVLENADAAVLSIEDVQGNESRIEDMLASIPVLVVTEGVRGARLYWNGDLRYFKPPAMVEKDPTGAGDVFAAAFFIRLSQTRDPWEAARFATQLAANSVTRPGLAGTPSPDEVQTALLEIISKV
ncbi:MAG TPA: PfkB family carbohydrate kinase [Longilinea sp.]|nr:PfkB family carbohydrate kinase [Longilinea sp.]